MLLLQQWHSTPCIHVFHNLLLQLGHVQLQAHYDTAQVRVLALQNLHLVLQLGDPLQLTFATLGRGYPVPVPFPLQLDLLLILHVDRTQRRRIGHRIRFILNQWHRIICKQVEICD